MSGVQTFMYCTPPKPLFYSNFRNMPDNIKSIDGNVMYDRRVLHGSSSDLSIMAKKAVLMDRHERREELNQRRTMIRKALLEKMERIEGRKRGTATTVATGIATVTTTESGDAFRSKTSKPGSSADAEASFSPDNIKPDSSAGTDDKSISTSRSMPAARSTQGGTTDAVQSLTRSAAASPRSGPGSKTVDSGRKSASFRLQKILSQIPEGSSTTSANEKESELAEVAHEDGVETQCEKQDEKTAVLAVTAVGSLEAAPGKSATISTKGAPPEQNELPLISEVASVAPSQSVTDAEADYGAMASGQPDDNRAAASEEASTGESAVLVKDKEKKDTAKDKEEEKIGSSDKSGDKNDSGFPIDDNHAGLSDVENSPLQDKLPDDSEVSSLKRWVEELKQQRNSDLTKLIQLEKRTMALEEANKLSAQECCALRHENQLLHARFIATQCLQEMTARSLRHVEQRSQALEPPPTVTQPAEGAEAEVEVDAELPPSLVARQPKRKVESEIRDTVVPWLTRNVVKLLTYRFHKLCLRNEVYGLTPHFVNTAMSHGRPYDDR